MADRMTWISPPSGVDGERDKHPGEGRQRLVAVDEDSNRPQLLTGFTRRWCGTPASGRRIAVQWPGQK